MENLRMRLRSLSPNCLVPAFLLALALLGALGAGAARAAAPVNTNWRGLAIKGYDAVAYFEEGKPVAGKAEHAFAWMGATWRFASARNLDRFRARPAHYAPQYGGYCAWAVSQGYTADIDPDAWKIVDGKLYLNYNKSVQANWEKDVPGNVAKADANWPGIAGKKN